MAFCVNCGIDTRGAVALCPQCYRDPAVPSSQWAKQINHIIGRADGNHYRDFSFKGEKFSLIVAILITFFAIISLSVVTLGILPIFLAIQFFKVRFDWMRTRARLMPVTEDSYPNLFRMARVAAGRLRIPVPKMFVKQSPVLNAYTTGIFDDGWIVLNSALIESLSDDEIMTIIGHEMGHIKLRHVTWLIFTNTGEQGVGFGWVSLLLWPIFNTWSHRSEYSADRAGLIATGSVDACVRAELKLMTGKSLPADFDLQAWLKNVMGEKETITETVSQLMFDSHPFARRRVRQIVNYSRTDEFKQIWQTYSKPDPAIAG